MEAVAPFSSNSSSKTNLDTGNRTRSEKGRKQEKQENNTTDTVASETDIASQTSRIVSYSKGESEHLF